ncbi:substrate-binding periplasmic protein [Microbacterium mangrovi]|uniref:substrate-binding periplasmic protein n=1 Tax=Microbacterium mangrovi TaxID=1348253 RepID=UPI00068D50CC|nr:transporter substrate-binding domain-containing protein [Microbacterium mangrovi]
MKKALPLAALTVAALLALTGCDSTPPGAAAGATGATKDCTPRDADLKTISTGTLTVAQYDYVPFSMSDAPGKLTGLEGDVLTKFAQAECLTLQINKGDAAAMITSVSTGRADTTLGSWYRTAERAKVVRLSAPVVTSPLSVVSKNEIATVDELEKAKVGVGHGLVGVDKLQALLGSSLKLYQNDDAVYDDLNAGRINATVGGFIAANQYLKKHDMTGYEVTVLQSDERLPATVQPGQTNFPVNLQNAELGEAIDSYIAELRASGELDKIAEKYGLDPKVMHPAAPNLL